MKIKNILFVSLFAGAVLSSCDYTDLSPIDSITDKTYWTTTNDLKLYANGLYGLLASHSFFYLWNVGIFIVV